MMQGGSGYPFFAPCVFQYICGKELSEIMISRDEIPDQEIVSALQRVLHDSLFDRFLPSPMPTLERHTHLRG